MLAAPASETASAVRPIPAGTAPKPPFPPPARARKQQALKGVRVDFNDGSRVVLPTGEWHVVLRDYETDNGSSRKASRIERRPSKPRFPSCLPTKSSARAVLILLPSWKQRGNPDPQMEAFDPNGVDQTVFVVGERHDTLDEPWRAYRHARLIHVSDGVLTVRTETGRWVVPPGHAVWIVPNVLHCLHATRPVQLYSLYATPDAAPLPAQSGALVPDALVQALLGAAAALPYDQPFDEPANRLMQVLLDRLPGLRSAPLGLNWPGDPRIERIAAALSDDPAQPAVLEELAAAAGVTARTAARLFVKETGQTFGQWRQQLRLLVALEHLGGGASVTQVALDVGYNDVSSFIAVFREAFGDTPARYFR